MSVELTPIAEQTAEQQEQTLLTEIANKAQGVSNWQDLRWFAVGGNNPRAIVIVKRGKDKTQVANISPSNPEAWQSWQPVLAQWLAERAQTNNRRVNHDKLPTGKI